MQFCINRKEGIVLEIKYGLLLAEFLVLFLLRLVQGPSECCREKPEILVTGLCESETKTQAFPPRSRNFFRSS